MIRQIVKIFTEEESKLIVNDFEKNKDHIKLSRDHGVERISSYEIDVQHFSEDIKELIYSKIESKLKPITKGNWGWFLVFVILWIPKVICQHTMIVILTVVLLN